MEVIDLEKIHIVKVSVRVASLYNITLAVVSS